MLHPPRVSYDRESARASIRTVAFVHIPPRGVPSDGFDVIQIAMPQLRGLGTDP